MSDERIDLGPLDPTGDRERFEGVVRAIVAAAGPELMRRRARAGVMTQIALWSRPLLAAAAIAGLVAAAALARVRPAPSAAGSEVGIAEAVGVPQRIARWVRGEEEPDPADLLVALEMER